MGPIWTHWTHICTGRPSAAAYRLLLCFSPVCRSPRPSLLPLPELVYVPCLAPAHLCASDTCCRDGNTSRGQAPSALEGRGNEGGFYLKDNEGPLTYFQKGTKRFLWFEKALFSTHASSPKEMAWTLLHSGRTCKYRKQPKCPLMVDWRDN